MAGIFISYRREDATTAGRLVDGWRRCSRAKLFMDIDAIEPGLDYL